jgi:chlorobactene glucosyltransferase
MLLYQWIVTIVLALLLVNTGINLLWLRCPSHQPPPDDAPFVSILIPARNEARSIVRCVESLAQQDYPRFEILVLDDHSEDDTAALVERMGHISTARLLRGEPLPAGWHGKAYACAQLARAARGEWLLFVDADTVHAPDCLSATMRAALTRRADLLTMIPRIQIGSVGEAVLLPVIGLMFGSLMPLPLVTHSRWSFIAGALGPFLLFRREMYDRIGGHAAVRAEIVEDMRLSRMVKRHGGRVTWIDGTRLMRIRFYHTTAEAWQGVAKSTFTAIQYSLFALAVGLPIVLALFVAPYAFLLDSLISQHFSVTLFWLPLAQVGCVWTSQLWVAARFQLARGMAFLHGVTMLAVSICTLSAAYQALAGQGVAWKGRTYQFYTASMVCQLTLARCLLAACVIVLGRFAGDQPVRVAALLTLIMWSIAVLEGAGRYQAERNRVVLADCAGAVACLIYLAEMQMLDLWPMMLAVLISLVVARWLGWRDGVAIGFIACGSILLLRVASEWSTLPLIVLAWLIGVLLLKRHLLTDQIGDWVHRVRSSSDGDSLRGR